MTKPMPNEDPELEAVIKRATASVRIAKKLIKQGVPAREAGYRAAAAVREREREGVE